ncbi:MAG: hypothetical protein IJG68_01750 [Bacilli bacterium]|nr:hypothetical protein [Bacilli bacterium]
MKLGIKFGINAVVAGQKTALVNATPQLIVKSTPGQFTITSPVSKALGIAVGENVMFLNNINEVERALQNPSDAIMNYCNANGWDINTRQGQDEFIKDQTIWYIAKGVLLYKSNGEPVLGTVRITKEDKLAYIAEKGLEFIQSLSDEDKAALAAAKNMEDASDEDLAAALTADDIASPTFHSASGSKTSATAKATGVGLQLNFTDSSVWDALKTGLDDKTSVNRVFDVKLDEAEPFDYRNGKAGDDGIEKIMVYPLSFVEDKAPISRNKKDSDEVAED